MGTLYLNLMLVFRLDKRVYGTVGKNRNAMPRRGRGEGKGGVAYTTKDKARCLQNRQRANRDNHSSKQVPGMLVRASGSLAFKFGTIMMV